MKRTLVKVVQTCSACPSQWDMWDTEGNYYYVRYCFGCLTVRVGPTGSKLVLDMELIVDKTVGKRLDGFMSWFDLITILRQYSFEVGESFCYVGELIR